MPKVPVRKRASKKSKRGKRPKAAARKPFRRWHLLLAAAGVIMFLILIFVGTKIKFAMNDELILALTPAEKIINTTNSKTISLDFNIKTRSFLQCTSVCELFVFDYARNEIIFRNNYTLKHNGGQDVALEFKTPSLGAGKSLFNVGLVCNNLKSKICMTEEDKRYASSLVILDYGLREEEKAIIADIGGKLEYDLGLFANLSILNIQNNVLRARLALSPDSNIGFDELQVYRDLWDAQRYEELAESFTDLSLQLLEKRNALESAQRQLISEILRHNNLVALFDFPTGEIESLLDHLQQNNNAHNHEILNKLESHSRRIQAESEKMLADKTPGNISADVESLLRITREELDKLAEARRILNLYNDFLKARNLSIETTGLCSDTALMIHSVNSWNAIINASFQNHSQNNPNSTQITPETIYSIEDTSNQTGIYLSTRQIEKIDELHCYDEDYDGEASPFQTQRLVANNYTLTDFYIDSSIPPAAIHYEGLSIPSPSCCAFGGCNSCSTDKTPVLFIHGHSFNNENTPETSMNAFGKIENSLRDAGFINAGRLDTSNAVSWENIGYPTTARATYYYITYYGIGAYTFSTQKSERIENYALRLKEVIDIYRQKTNSTKITVVAHSMGGLVAREYLLLFGSDSVDKLILINTPNKGVKGRVQTLCSVIGAKKECEDMSEGSVFLSRLNSRPASNVEIHAIFSSGCDTDGEDGDGIVAVESAKLGNAILHEIKGNCTDVFGTNLHTDVLDIDEYPETLGILKEILK